MQQGTAEPVADRYLQGDREAVALVDGWIARAASPYRARLLSQWDDLLQAIRIEVMRLLRNGAFRAESSLKTYLWRVVNNTCLDHLRAQTRVVWTTVDVIDDVVPSTSPSPLSQVLQKESAQMLLQVLGQMPAECRQLWGLILEGHSYKAISDRLATSEGALRVRALRCRRKAVAVRRQVERLEEAPL